jgi:predicted dehydrogenase
MGAVTTFGIVGSGWRTMFILRLARALPDRLRATGVVTRTAQRAAQVTAATSIPAFTSIDGLLSHERSDYVIVSTNWETTPVVTRELVARGVRVLAETPPAPDLAGLRALWADVGRSGLVQVAEQYLLMPAHAARLAVLRSGTIGEVTSVQLSSTHLYHAVSLIRGFLPAGRSVAGWAMDRRRHPTADPHHPGDPRLRRWPIGALRLHRQPVVEPVAGAAHRDPG